MGDLHHCAVLGRAKTPLAVGVEVKDLAIVLQADNHPTPVEAPQPPAFVEISFWSYKREEWKRSDSLRVDPSDPSPVERIARKYSWKNYSLYDRDLQSLSPAQCYRAATVDDTIIMPYS